MAINKKSLSEADIAEKYISPALEAAGWDIMTQVRREYYFTAGRILTNSKKGRRKEGKRCDYLLYLTPELPIAIIEAKENNHDPEDGIQQALEYARILDILFVFTCNGDRFCFFDKTVDPNGDEDVEKDLALAAFPSPEALWQRYCRHHGLDLDQQPVIRSRYYQSDKGVSPRYYQMNAINRATQAVIKNQKRLLLVMATGTGKTYTAFQIIWRLWKTRQKKRVLFLADRNILIDQTLVGDFKPFGSAMAKLSAKSKTIERGEQSHDVNTAVAKGTRKIDQSYQIYLGLYQAVSGKKEERDIYKKLPRDFFDLVIVDECHRGSAKEESSWREILEYFSSATQIGLTATPVETKKASNIHYFNDPVYTYSLKDGIDDGFLAPYRVIRVDLDRDVQGWRPEKGKRDKYGREIKDRIYTQSDYDRKLEMRPRHEIVAQRITDYLKAGNRYDKTIVFCQNIKHAKRMRRALANLNKDEVLKNDRYVVRITGDDDKGKVELDNFIDPESRYPVIAVTSKLMNTGVDAQTCKLIVIDQTIKSQTVFKQIIGRGTRIREDYGKTWFTIMDFRKATERFADPDFDDQPIMIYQPSLNDPMVPPEDVDTSPEDGSAPNDPPAPNPADWILTDDADDDKGPYVVEDVSFKIIAEREQHYDGQGKLRIESMKAHARETLHGRFQSLDEFIQTWSDADQRRAVIDQLTEFGVDLDTLQEEVGRDLDPIDLLCHLAYDAPPLTRRERADNVHKRNYFARYSETAQKVLAALLDKYADEGVTNFSDLKLLKVPPINHLGTPIELVGAFGGKEGFLDAVRTLEEELYSAA